MRNQKKLFCDFCDFLEPLFLRVCVWSLSVILIQSRPPGLRFIESCPLWISMQVYIWLSFSVTVTYSAIGGHIAVIQMSHVFLVSCWLALSRCWHCGVVFLWHVKEILGRSQLVVKMVKISCFTFSWQTVCCWAVWRELKDSNEK